MTESSPKNSRIGEAGVSMKRREAEGIVEDIEQAAALAENAIAKSRRWSRALGKAGDSLQALIRMIQSYASGEYKEIPAHSIVVAVAAILYFLAPVDFVPDFLLGVGFIDDAAVIGWAISRIYKDVKAFEEWEESNLGETPAAVDEPSEDEDAT